MADSISSDIAKLIDQTCFLLEKQRESQSYCVERFGELLSLMSSAIKNVELENDGIKLEKLQRAYEILSSHFGKFEEQTMEEVGFLEDQLQAIKEVEALADPIKTSQFLDSLLDSEKLIDTSEFKKEVEEEAKSSKQSFSIVLNDLKYSLQEGSIDDMLAYLEDLEEKEDQEDGLSFSPQSQEDEDSDQCCMSDKGQKFKEGEFFEAAQPGKLSGEDAVQCCGGKFDCGSRCVCSDSCRCS